MDPQRQYAQLLTLWSQGSKMFRRSEHLDIPYDKDWNAWWRLGRRLVERGMTVLPVSAGHPALLAATPDAWFTLCPVEYKGDGVSKGTVIAVQRGEGPALAWDGEWMVSYEAARRLGRRGWDALVRWSCAMGTELMVPAMDDALTLLGALQRQPALFQIVSRDDWVSTAQMLRHPGRRMTVGQPLPASWGFCYDGVSRQAWWQGQDEDSVH